MTYDILRPWAMASACDNITIYHLYRASGLQGFPDLPRPARWGTRISGWDMGLSLYKI